MIPSAVRDRVIYRGGTSTLALSRVIVDFDRDSLDSVDWSNTEAASSAIWVLERKRYLQQFEDDCVYRIKTPGLEMYVFRSSEEHFDGRAVRVEIWNVSNGDMVSLAAEFRSPDVFDQFLETLCTYRIVD